MHMALSLDTAEIAEIEEAASWGVLGGVAPNVLVTCPCTPAGLAATHRPFAGPVDDISWDGLELVEEICDMFAVQQFETKVLAASLRHPIHVLQAARAGADIATMPFGVFKMLVRHPLTDQGLAGFMADWKKLQEETAAL